MARLAKAAITITAMIRVPPKNAMFGERFMGGRKKVRRAYLPTAFVAVAGMRKVAPNERLRNPEKPLQKLATPG